MRFNSPEEIDDQIILSYVQEAIQNQKAGKEIKINSAKKIEIPQELDQAFMNQPELKTNFDTFTPGKQREFAEYISEAKRSETRLKRLEKIIPLILQGIGLNDKYKS